MNVKERIKKFIEHKGLPVSKFEEQCELSNGYISAMRKGFGADKLNNVLNVFPELNREWLLYGEGEMLKVPATVTMYNPTAEERQEAGDGIDMSIYPAEVVEEIKAEVVEEIEKEMIVPIVPREVAANAETNIKEYIEDNASELEHFDPRKITASVDGAERICTTSMFPTFQPHDIVFVKFLKDKTRITDGKIYYFDTHTHPTMIRLVKKLDNGNLRLIALNARYGDIIIGFDQITNIGEIKGMYRETFSDQYAEMEEIRRRKDAQVDKLVEQNGEALKIIHDLIKR
jgi:phage repressor protein C with HTH and peptisase S24 domain